MNNKLKILSTLDRLVDRLTKDSFKLSSLNPFLNSIDCDCKNPKVYYDNEPDQVWEGICSQCKTTQHLYVICDSCKRSFCSDECFKLYHGIQEEED